MGIEQFYFAIKRKLELVGESLHGGKTMDQELKEATYIYIDFNAVIHRISEKVVYDKNMEFVKLIDKTNDREKRFNFINKVKNNLENEIINNIINELDEIIKKSKKVKEIYIAFDGIPEISKCVEQKHRKTLGFIRTEIENKLNNVYDDPYQKYQNGNHKFFEKNKFSFSKSNISLHADFMKILSKRMKKDYSNNDKIIISDVDEYGEGEKKIMYHIFYKDTKISNDDNILIFSPDADVVQLASVAMYRLGINNIFPLIYVYNKDLIDINNFARYISKLTFKEEIIDNKKIISLLKDYICLFSFFGNDFLPKILSLNNVFDNIDTLINIYQETMKNDFGSLIIFENNNHKINFSKFKLYLENLGREEEYFYKKYIDSKKKEERERFNVSYYDCAKYVISNEYYFFNYINFLNTKAKLFSNKDKKQIEDLIDIDANYNSFLLFSNYIEKNKNDMAMRLIVISEFVDHEFPFKKFDYELIAFRSKKSAWKLILNEKNYYNDEEIPIEYKKENVIEYLDGFNWVLDWYFDRMIDKSSLYKMSVWFYSEHYAPFIKNILDYIIKNNIKEINKNLQLIDKNKFLIKSEHKIYTDPSPKEKENLLEYIDKIILLLQRSKINYVLDKSGYIEKKMSYNGWDRKIIIDCRYARYFEKCNVKYHIYSWNEFIKKYRMQGGYYKKRYIKYINKKDFISNILK